MYLTKEKVTQGNLCKQKVLSC